MRRGNDHSGEDGAQTKQNESLSFETGLPIVIPHLINMAIVSILCHALCSVLEDKMLKQPLSLSSGAGVEKYINQIISSKKSQ